MKKIFQRKFSYRYLGFKKMRYEQIAPRKHDQSNNEFKLRRALWALMTGTGLILISWQMNIINRFKKGNFTQKNSFRFCIIMMIVLICFASYLLYNTRKYPIAERSSIMTHEFPIAAYSMTASALFVLIGTFILFTDLLEAFGILFYICFWGFFFNILFVLA